MELFRNDGDNTAPAIEEGDGIIDVSIYVNSFEASPLSNTCLTSCISVPADVSIKPFIFQLVAYDGLGELKSPEGEYLLAGVPAIPSIPTQDYTLTTENQIAVELTAIASSNNGADIIGYQLWRDDGKSSTFSTVHDANIISANTYIDTFVTPYVTYGYKYRAYNTIGWGNFSDIGYLIAANSPNTPTVSLDSVDNTQITINVDHSTASLVSKFELYMDEGDLNTEFTKIAESSTSFSHPLTLLSDGLILGKIYSFKARAQNIIGYSDYSPSKRVGFGAQAPQPSNLRVTEVDVNEGRIVIEWDSITPTDLDILGYHVEQGLTNPIVIEEISDPDITQAIVNGLIKGPAYYFKVQSFNFNGFSDPSSILEAYA
jgi:hypothetical protein